MKDSLKYAKHTSSILEEWARYPAWGMVKFFCLIPGMHPHIIVLIGLITRLAAIGLLFAYGPSHHVTAALLLLLGMFLDAADGQFARHTNITSSLGALYDLASDFLCYTAMFIAFTVITLAQHPEYSALIIATGCLSYVCFLTTTEAWTYIVWRQNNGDKHANSQRAFYNMPAIDTKPWPHYAIKTHIMRRVFEYTWGIFAQIAFSHPGWKTQLKKPGLIHLYALAGGTTQMSIAAALLISAQPLYFFFAYQIVLFVLFLPLIRYNEKE